MSIKIDLRNQVRQTNLPKWKPLLPVFEAVLIIETFAAMSTSIYRALLSDVMVAQCNYIE